jgi:hypothetical protein
LTFFIICSIHTFAQAPDTLWTRTYGGLVDDFGFDVRLTSDSGYITVGYTRSYGNGNDDVFLIKTDSNGDTMWTKTFGGTENDRGYSLKETLDSGYIIAGSTQSFGAGSLDVYLIKTNVIGDTIWTKTYGGSDDDRGFSVQQTSDQGYVITGLTESFGFYADVWLIKVDSVGDTLWTKTYGAIGHDVGLSVAKTSDQGYIITGWTNSFIQFPDIYVIKTDSLGDTLWTKTYGGLDWDEGYTVEQTSDGGFIIGGITSSYGSGNWDIYLLKTDSLGDTIWTRTYGSSSYDYCHSVHELTDGGYVVIGYTASFGSGYSDIYLLKIDTNGDTLWTKTYGGVDYDYGYSVKETHDSGYIVAGATESFGAGFFDVYLLKLESETGMIAGNIEKGGLLLEVHPNPFRQMTSIKFQIPNSEFQIKIYDSSGRMIKNIPVPSSYFLVPSKITWDGRDHTGHVVPTGVYFVQLDVYGRQITRKVIRLK